jgi:ABC-type bacteriocin/lantibiotic exporter with double-glycine peptidase domain
MNDRASGPRWVAHLLLPAAMIATWSRGNPLVLALVGGVALALVVYAAAPRLPWRRWLRRRIAIVSNGDGIDDGSAVLTMLLRYHGVHADPAELLREIGRPDGVSTALDLMKAAERRGVKLVGYRIEAHELQYLELPCIVHRHLLPGRGPERGHGNHGVFELLEQVRADEVVLVDTRAGVRRRESTADFLDYFSGVALVRADDRATAPAP